MVASRLCAVLLVAGLATSLVAAHAAPAAEPPLVSRDLPAGHLRLRDVAPTPAEGRRARPADGSTAHWVGRPSGFAGSAVQSHGELVYTDHLWDAYGASGPADAANGALLDALAGLVPQVHRLQDAVLGLSKPTYGAGPVDYAADIDEVRLAAPGDAIDLLVRTTVMTAAEQPAVLVLVDSTPGGPVRARPLAVPFNSGITTRRADIALLVTARRGVAVDLLTGARRTFATAADADGYANALEASIPDVLAGSPRDTLQVAVAAGRLEPATGELRSRQTGPALANVAFRGQEPTTPFFDKLQSAALAQGTIDPFFTTVDLRSLRAGVTQRATAGPGYYERVMTTDPAISREDQDHGILQPYGLYVPPGIDVRRPVASTIYLHGSGSHANLEPVIIPGLMRALGDQRGSVVIAPQGRTAFSMWEGAAIEDVFEARRDASRVVQLEPTHSTLAGQSMGGYGAFLLAALFPDRFAASWSLEGLIGGFAPTPVSTLAVPDVRRIFQNLRWVPFLIRQGAADFNVDVVNGLAAEDALHRLGYRSRLLLFPADIHYTADVLDRWEPEVRYLAASPAIDPDPPRVTYTRSIPFEREVNQASGSDQTIFPAGGHDIHFDHAYWMRGLTPADATSGVAAIDVHSLAIPAIDHRVAAEHGAGTSGGDPYTSSGDAWLPIGVPTRRSNAFTLTLDGARAVTLDARRMRLATCRPVTASVQTEHAVTLRLAGRWRARTRATANGRRLRAVVRPGALILPLRAGRSTVRITLRCA